ncbi:MAG: hypothetical protein VKI81_04695 [Synechococcaceae cyanobacterium]|nr:hypothetical protein [Synechococcaceae cyanobacterium]
MAKALRILGWACFILFPLAVLPNLVPIRFTTIWLQEQISGVISNAFLPLFGIGFTILAALFNPEDEGNRRLFRWSLRRWTVLVPAALGFLLLVPVQVLVTSRGISEQTRTIDQQLAASNRQSEEVRQAAANARTPDELRQALAPLSERSRAAFLSQPLPEARKNVVRMFEQADKELSQTLRNQRRNLIWDQARRGIRFILLSSTYALTLLAVAQLKLHHVFPVPTPPRRSQPPRMPDRRRPSG